MPSLDIFRSDAFGVISMTAAINRAPYKPARLGELGLFKSKPVNTLSVFIEEQNGRLSLLSTAARGSMPTYEQKPDRKVRTFRLHHVPANDTVLADSVQGVRAFGSETELETVSGLVNDKLAQLRADHEVTHEFHRIGALKGVLLDADGSTVLYNLFDEFGVTETTFDFDFTVGAEDMKQNCLDVTRTMEDILGMTSFTGIEACCGNDFFDDFISHETVKFAFERQMENKFAREANEQRKGFEFCNINWWNYRGKVAGQNFIAANECRFYPVGVPDLFQAYWGPADFIETVNTMGKPIYAKQEVMKFDKGVEIHTQSNHLHICTRPACLLKGTT